MGKIIKKTFKIIFVGIVVLIYGLLMWRVFIGCDSSVADQILLNDEYRPLFENDRENFVIKKILPDFETMDKAGRVQISRINAIGYKDSLDNFQFTVKYNIDHIKNAIASERPHAELDGCLLKFELEKDGVRYTEYQSVEDRRYDYYYVRCAFSDIPIETYRSEGGYECISGSARLNVYANLDETEEELLIMTIELYKDGDACSDGNGPFVDTN